ncbi:MAG: hypothetical protein ACRYG6_15065 [Janthinobacterium lividum]
MELPFAFPDWVPWWVQTLLVVAGVLFALAFLLMPFAVFGVKSRLDSLELHLEELGVELRSLSLRLPDRGVSRDLATNWTDPVPEPVTPHDALPSRPPIPPAPRTRDVAPDLSGRTGARRTEPRFDRSE